MTSKHYYLKLILDSMKRRIWYGALLFLTFFFSMPLAAMMYFDSKANIYQLQLQDAEKLLSYNNEVSEFIEYVSYGNPYLLILVCGAAILGAWSGLAWLHSRRKMDLYGCLPIKREQLLFVESTATFLLFFLPYLANLLLIFLVGMTKEIFTMKALRFGLSGILVYVIVFLAFYFFSAIAMLLTGKVLTGILGTCVMLVIGPMTLALLQELPIMFLDTYVSDTTLFYKLLPYLSPIGCVVTFTDHANLQISGAEKFVTEALLVLIITGILSALICLWLMKKRPAEGAEQSMVFPKTEGIIKAIILFPMGIGGGLIFDSFTRNGQYYAWFWFGMVLTLFLVGILIEIIYHLDRKRIFDHKIWTLGSSACVLGISLIFALDLMGYDQWIPQRDSVTNMTMQFRYSYWNFGDELGGVDNSSQYLEQHIEELQGDCVYALAQEGISNLNRELEEDCSWATVVYKMKNGSIKKREYRIATDTLIEAEKQLYEETLYKYAQLPILMFASNKVEVDDIFMNGRCYSLEDLSTKQRQDIANTYREELSHMSYEEIYQPGSGTMDFRYWVEDDNHSYYLDGVYALNEDFVETCALIKAYGVELQMGWPDVEQIRSVSIDYTAKETEDVVVRAGAAEQTIEEEIHTVEITEKDEIEKILEGLVCTSELSPDYYGMEYLDDEYTVYIEYIPEQDYEIWSSSGAYEKGKVPQFVVDLCS